jgi:hypothetical protein
VALLEVLSISSLVHQRIQSGHVLSLDLDKPALALGILSKIGRRVNDRAVDVDDRTRHGRVDVRGRLDRFDAAEGLALGGLFAFAGELNVDNVAESFSGIVGDANCAWGNVN